jgi:hypothetical protein
MLGGAIPALAGTPPRTLKAGESFFIPVGKPVASRAK